jgi:hypothetical protein
LNREVFVREHIPIDAIQTGAALSDAIPDLMPKKSTHAFIKNRYGLYRQN